ncbi:hypothetical protein IX317_002145 [Fusobacterium sp. DD29]|uniref:hypothetical protein n=1 Tax=unclassified Fusobacterium TaxID=2648384 RepID=UPI001B8AD362|nr:MULTISPECIES: hypothetical protein [unclassified Fusobacterium]MBR8750423.1 hypothetical protein [Fusobacterium sp. DD29]MBR8762664.1 hypothetical protein [Fusobacterium sp. DD25]MBR8768679.1 hypothetical protein [Fusobacterium sp. DD43]MBR8772752.1 hypothetical protein [Fusobacterium sp. DD40]MBR8776961.1 hypothetical protein [Fusobacterium sp. DD17]
MDKIEVYTAKEVAEIFNCSLSTAYNKIKYLNQELAKQHGINKKCLFQGRISKAYFNKVYNFVD